VFARELSAPGRTASLAARAGSALVSQGYHSQVQVADEGLALFRIDEAGRRTIRQENGRFLVGDQAYAAAALMREASERPGSFSPNVLLRPIVQDTIFPTACYVAGPSELAYLGQLREVYDHFGVPMPLMYPRASATLLDSAALRFMQKYGLSLEALQPQDDRTLNALLEAQIPSAVEDSLKNADQTIEAAMERVAAAVGTLDPTLQGASKSTLGRMQHDLGALHGKIIQAAKRRDETLRRQYYRTRALAFPNGHPQEREIGFVSFLNQYGSALVDRLQADLPLDLGRHWVVSI
jgi:bacillithiol biosynthesis cysteine-adding enzyme BshC